jgi:hypothetical protein
VVTPHEVHSLVIAAVGTLPWVTRIDYVQDAWGVGVMVTCGNTYWATEHAQLETMPVEEIRARLEAAYYNTRRYAGERRWESYPHDTPAG